MHLLFSNQSSLRLLSVLCASAVNSLKATEALHEDAPGNILIKNSLSNLKYKVIFLLLIHLIDKANKKR